MSSSGLIYAVIVGAWAVYLVPMWLRRQDELNERRDRERFTTAIRLLGRKPSMERWYASEIRARSTASAPSRNRTARQEPAARSSGALRQDDAAHGASPSRDGTARDDAAARRTPGPDAPAARSDPGPSRRVSASLGSGAATGLLDTRWSTRVTSGWETMRRRSRRAAAVAAELERRRAVLARRRRVVSALFLLFSIGVLASALGGFGWVPLAVIPALLLSIYIPYLRAQERRRYAARMRRREAVARAAARRAAADPSSPAAGTTRTPGASPAGGSPGRPGAAAGPGGSPAPDTRQAQWLADLDASHRNAPGSPATRGEPWDPVAVPRPTYADAPVADHPAPSVPDARPARPVTQPTPLDHYRRAAGE